MTARKLEKIGAFSLLVEGVDALTAREITRSVSIPTIGIGASPECDGQVLVTEDMLGLFTEYTPKFVKKYIDLSQLIKTSFSEYEQEVRNGVFPTSEHCFD
ncbi:3-methyl-2-oxobutanoate hydroxymethyltransferase [Vibrio sp. 10N.286.45.A3]|uniref:3-methyl-2-oxobutanoate hydroxymethyltransferase n=1 Tax=Vibrio sp. 10N.286.45.A3 TaxID=2056188 RepID=UPI0021593FB5|nr:MULTISPECIES: 3-methyl-2-oxobutanoate hydroxymethyltransferase [unclassified Vibrio]